MMLFEQKEKNESRQEEIQITKENLDFFLAELGKVLKKTYKKQHIELVLVGGASVLVNYGFRGTTTDIDALLRGAYSISQEINMIGDKYNLPQGWLNMDFVRTSSYSPRLAEVSKHYKTFSGILEVRTVADEYLIAMKLMSAREYKNDKSDIVGTLASLEKNGKELTIEKIYEAINKLYGSVFAVSQKSLSFLQKIMKDKTYRRLYDEIQEDEKNKKIALIKFEEKYPDVLTENNLEEILQKLSNFQKENTGGSGGLLEPDTPDEDREP